MSIDRITSNVSLRIPNYDEPQWHVPVDENWAIIDAMFGTLTRISGLVGTWQNATDYVQGQRVIETETGLLFEAAVTHTSASTGLFSADRAANPTYWTEVITLYTVNGRAIHEVTTVTDPSAQFTTGGTFEVDPTNPRHYYIKVGDSSNPLTANMTIDLNPADGNWTTGAKITIIKGDTSPYNVVVYGFDADGEGTYTLQNYRNGLECSYQTTDTNNGPGDSGQKFERGLQVINGVDGNTGIVTVKHGTASALATENATLVAGQPAFETDTGVLKIGVGNDYNSTDDFGTTINAVVQTFERVTPTVTDSATTIDDDFLAQAITIVDGAITQASRTLAMIDTGDTSNDFTADLDFGTATGGEIVVVEVPLDLTGTVTLRSVDYGTTGLIDGAASRVMPAYGFFLIQRLPGETASYRTSLIDSPDFVGLVTFSAGISNPFAATTSGLLTMAAHSGKIVPINGNTTIPVTDGFTCRIISAGSHTVGAGGTAVALTAGQSIVIFTNGTTVYRSAVETLTTMPTS